jgi:hypothetical protein
MIRKQAIHQRSVANVAVNEYEVGQTRKVVTVSRIGERIEYDNAISRVMTGPVADEIGADESGAPGDQYSRHCS